MQLELDATRGNGDDHVRPAKPPKSNDFGYRLRLPTSATDFGYRLRLPTSGVPFAVAVYRGAEVK